MKSRLAIAAGLVTAVIALFPSHGFAGASNPSSGASVGCAAGAPQVVFRNKSKWLLALINTTDPAQMPPPSVGPGEDQVWCVTGGDASSDIAYSVNENSGSIISYTLAQGAISTISVLPEGGPPTAYCSLSADTYAGQPAVVLTYYTDRPDPSAVNGVCNFPKTGSSSPGAPGE